MNKEITIKLFEQKQVRSVWSEEEEKLYFSIIDGMVYFPKALIHRLIG